MRIFPQPSERRRPPAHDVDEDLNVYERVYWILTALSVALIVGAVVFLMLVLSGY